MSDQTIPTPTRRATLAWIAAAAASPLAIGGMARAAAAPVADPVRWPGAVPPKIAAKGYGTDPDLAAKTVPWPLTLAADQRALVALCADMVLPPAAGQKAPSALAIDAFVDEWISAPYARQAADRAAILPGLAWLDAEARARCGRGFAAASVAQRSEILDAIAWRDRVAPSYREAAAFFARLRAVVILGYYTTPEGEAELGFAGNTPIQGVYPGAPPEAIAHLKAQLDTLGLRMPAA